MIDIKRVQDRLLEMAKCVCSILDRQSIPYVITYGTLLGAIRHRGFIPWDDDFDLYLFSETYDSAISILTSELPNNLFLENELSEPRYFHGWAHIKDLNSEVYSKQFPQDNAYVHHGLSIDLYKATRIPREQLSLFQLTEQKKYYVRRFQNELISKDDYQQKASALDLRIEEETGKRVLHPEDEIYAFMSLDGDYLEINEVFPLKIYHFAGECFLGPNSFHDFLTRCYGDYMELPPPEKRIPHYSEVHFVE